MFKEKEIMDIIVRGGDARSSSLKAVKLARQGKWDEVTSMLERAQKSLVKAHNLQTSLIQSEIRGEGSEVSLLMVHAQDHLMNAITVKELATEMIAECKRVSELEEKLKGLTNHV